jgi:hypothetical protein
VLCYGANGVNVFAGCVGGGMLRRN